MEGLPLFTEPYVPFLLGYGAISVLSGEPSNHERPPFGFMYAAVKPERVTECSSGQPCGWCWDCVGVSDAESEE